MKRKKDFLNFSMGGATPAWKRTIPRYEHISIAPPKVAQPIKPLTDSEGLGIAYKRKNGVYIYGDTAYIAGTKSLHDAWDDLKIPVRATKYSRRYQDAEKYITDPTLGIKHVVGHSLGGAVSLELEKRYPHLQSTTYASPTISPPWVSGQNSRYRNPLDPISILDAGASHISNKVSLNPFESHSFKNFDNTSGGTGGWVIGDTSKNTPWDPATSAFTTPPITQSDLKTL